MEQCDDITFFIIAHSEVFLIPLIAQQFANNFIHQETRCSYI